MAGNEKLNQMAVFNITPHSNMQLHVEGSVLFSFTSMCVNSFTVGRHGERNC